MTSDCTISHHAHETSGTSKANSTALMRFERLPMRNCACAVQNLKEEAQPSQNMFLEAWRGNIVLCSSHTNQHATNRLEK
jgi:hypothetical protein